MPDATSQAPRLADRLAISDLMTGWIHRDLGQWDDLRALFTAAIADYWDETAFEASLARERRDLALGFPDTSGTEEDAR